MTRQVTKEEIQILNSIEKIPFAPEDKSFWKEVINEGSLNEDVVKDIQSKLGGLQAGDEDPMELTRSTAELNRHIQTWRLSRNLRGFGNRGGRRRR
jgi:hypothetical protein